MIDENHIRACPEHGVVGASDDEPCPCCATGIEARPKGVKSESFNDQDMRWQVQPETMIELLPLLKENAEQVDEGPVYVAVAEADAGEGGGAFMGNAPGYTMQERWFNVAVVETGNQQRDIIKHESQAKEVIEAIEAGEQYVESPDYGEWRLDPDEWMTVLAPYIRDEDEVEFERVDDTTLRITVDVINEDIHSQMRREMGQMAKRVDLNIHTKNAGGRFEDSVIEVSTE